MSEFAKAFIETGNLEYLDAHMNTFQPDVILYPDATPIFHEITRARDTLTLAEYQQALEDAGFSGRKRSIKSSHDLSIFQNGH